MKRASRIARLIWGGFQQDFTYRLFDAGGKLLWERRQQRDECSPARAWVHDSGWVVVATKHTFGTDLLVLNSNGARIARFDLCDDKAGTSLHKSDLVWTSAGPFWHTQSVAYFAELDGAPNWCCRFFSGRRVIVNLWTCEFTIMQAAPAPELAAVESAWARDILTNASLDGISEPNPDKCPDIEELVKAMLIAGLHRIDEMLPKLFELEASPFEGGYTFAPMLGQRFCMSVLPVRQMAQRSIRRVGREPRGHAALTFWTQEPGGERVNLHLPEFVADRFEKAQSIRPKQAAFDVLQLLGAPDSMHPNSFDFLFAQPRPVVIHVNFGEATVKAVEETPMDWRHCDSGDYSILM